MVLPLTCTVNCDAPMTVARMRSLGSMIGIDIRVLNCSMISSASSFAMSP